MNYYERHIGDYQKDTATLSLLEHGAYTQLLDTYYATEMPLPADMARLYRVCRAVTADEQAAVAFVVEQFFPLADDGLRHNARADAEIAKAMVRITAAQENGKKGGRPPKNPGDNPPKNPGDNPPGNPNGNRPVNPPENPARTQPQSSPDPTRHTPPTSSRITARVTPVDLAVEGRKRGIDCAAHQPAVIALAEQGVSLETFAAACDYAKAEASDPSRVPIRFVASILTRWAKEAAEISAGGAAVPQRPPAPSSKSDANALALSVLTGAYRPAAKVIDHE